MSTTVPPTSPSDARPDSGPAVVAPATPATSPASPASPTPPKLYRSSEGRVVGGVAAGLARHLGISVAAVRIAFVLLAFANGAGIVTYAAFWWLVPLAPEGAVVAAPRAAGEREGTRWLGPLLALGALAAGVLLLLQQAGFSGGGPAAIPVLVLGLGVAVLWRVADDTQRARLRSAAVGGSGRGAWGRVAVGLLLVVLGAAAVLGARQGWQAAVYGLSGALVVVAGVALVAGPWLYRNARELADERRERIRSQERAELAAHVHDSVVQTLTLIQRNADDPRTVTRLARAEERALRQWLYRPGGPEAGSFRAALESAAAEVEDVHGGALDVVVVGDARLDDRLVALVQASREAMVNAAKYASDAGPVQVFGEVEPERATVFVRDRGPGFDPATVPDDRLGLRQSVVGRMERAGGTAEVVTAPGQGVEVRLAVPLDGVAGRRTREEPT